MDETHHFYLAGKFVLRVKNGTECLTGYLNICSRLPQKVKLLRVVTIKYYLLKASRATVCVLDKIMSAEMVPYFYQKTEINAGIRETGTQAVNTFARCHSQFFCSVLGGTWNPFTSPDSTRHLLPRGPLSPNLAKQKRNL